MLIFSDFPDIYYAHQADSQPKTKPQLQFSFSDHIAPKFNRRVRKDIRTACRLSFSGGAKKAQSLFESSFLLSLLEYILQKG